jgi:hypothetical protein
LKNSAWKKKILKNIPKFILFYFILHKKISSLIYLKIIILKICIFKNPICLQIIWLLSVEAACQGGTTTTTNGMKKKVEGIIIIIIIIREEIGANGRSVSFYRSS